MKIYLWHNESDEWKLHDSSEADFAKQLEKRKIVIGSSVKINDFAKIGNFVKIDDFAEIGSYTEIGCSTKIGSSVKTGNSVLISDFVYIGNSVWIDDFAEIGSFTKIGDFVKIGRLANICCSVRIGDFAEIYNFAEISDYTEIAEKFNQNSKDIFTELSVYIMTGVVMQKGVGVFYKSVRPDLIDFHSGKYQYKIGKGDKAKLQRNQNIECGEGWHWTSYEKAVAFVIGKEHKIISATIKLKDILSVYEKVRVKGFANVQEVLW